MSEGPSTAARPFSGYPKSIGSEMRERMGLGATAPCGTTVQNIDPSQQRAPVVPTF